MGMKPELFIIENETVAAMNIFDINKTFAAMAEAGVAGLPVNKLMIAFDPKIYTGDFYEDDDEGKTTELMIEFMKNMPDYWLAIQIEYMDQPIKLLDRNFLEEMLHLTAEQLEKCVGMVRFHQGWIHRRNFKMLTELVLVEKKQQQEGFSSIMRTLLVLLATKNAQKDRVENKPNSSSAKQRNASKNFAYTTTIRIGKITENCKSGGTGSPMRPHLRRGHVRNQPYGEGRREIKQIFIAPVFINADKEYVESQRIAYKIRA
jgi:hypothetical protein